MLVLSHILIHGVISKLPIINDLLLLLNHLVFLNVLCQIEVFEAFVLAFILVVHVEDDHTQWPLVQKVVLRNLM